MLCIILYWTIANLSSFVALNGRRYILLRVSFVIPYDSSFFSEVGGGRSSKSNNFSYNVLHDKVQIGGGVKSCHQN